MWAKCFRVEKARRATIGTARGNDSLRAARAQLHAALLVLRGLKHRGGDPGGGVLLGLGEVAGLELELASVAGGLISGEGQGGALESVAGVGDAHARLTLCHHQMYQLPGIFGLKPPRGRITQVKVRPVGLTLVIR